MVKVAPPPHVSRFPACFPRGARLKPGTSTARDTFPRVITGRPVPTGNKSGNEPRRSDVPSLINVGNSKASCEPAPRAQSLSEGALTGNIDQRIGVNHFGTLPLKAAPAAENRDRTPKIGRVGG